MERRQVVTSNGTVVIDQTAPFTLKGKAAIVTGAARGIGRAIVGRLASNGAGVLACDIDQEALEEMRSSIRGSGRVEVIQGDLMEAAFPQQVVDAALNFFGSIAILGNCRG